MWRSASMMAAKKHGTHQSLNMLAQPAAAKAADATPHFDMRNRGERLSSAIDLSVVVVISFVF